MAKKIMILAGTCFQIPVIEYAKKQGHYVITCDNRPENPGHKLSDKYYNVSTTDHAGILDIAAKERIDGILAYASDPAAPTAAYVSRKLDLPGSPYDSVVILSDKGEFRKFLKRNGFPVPEFRVFKNGQDAAGYFKSLGRDCYLKPVDSSGSKGITRLPLGGDLAASFNYAMNFSRKGEVIVEQEIKRKGPHIHGEAFVYKGELVFMFLGDQYFSKVNICAPVSTTVPSMFHLDIMQEIRLRLSKIIRLSGFYSGGLNIEIIRDSGDNIYFTEIGARSGGNFMPELISMATGFNLAMANVRAVLNEPVRLNYNDTVDKYYTQLIMHSPANGIFKEYNLNGQFDSYLKFHKEYYKKGDFVKTYRDSRYVMGVYLYEFKDKNVCNNFISYIKANDLIRIHDPEFD